MTIKNTQDYIQRFRQVRKAHQYELIDDYIELISDLIYAFGKVKQIEIALRLDVAQPTVAKMLKRLEIAGLIKKIPYRNITLTGNGKELAKKNSRRHYIVEKFLLSLGICQDIACRDAEGIEHHVSDETLAKFNNFIRNNIKFNIY